MAIDFGNCRPQIQGNYQQVTGGRGGSIVRVTTLADTGLPGSLRWAAAQSNCVIVFDVSGIFRISSSLAFSGNHVTIAGQTAPRPGVTIVYEGSFDRYTFVSITGNDVLAQHFAVLPANTYGQGLLVQGNDIICDHVSQIWHIDEGFMSYQGSRHLYWRCLTAEGLSTVAGTDVSHGSLIYSLVDDITFAQSLWASCYYRNPQIIGATTTRLINNFIYNWHYRAVHFENQIGGAPGDTAAAAWRTVLVGNRFAPGPGNASAYPFCISFDNFYGTAAGANQAYLDDNTAEANAYLPGIDVGAGLGGGGGNNLGYDPIVDSPPLSLADYEIVASTALEGPLLNSVGARPLVTERGPIETRIVDYILAREGPLGTTPGAANFPTSVDAVGGIPDLDSDEATYSDPANPNTVVGPHGRTNRDIYLDELALALEGEFEGSGTLTEYSYGEDVDEYDPYDGGDDEPGADIIGSDAYSDEEMACPAEWYGGYKEPWLIHAGDAERSLSDPMSGEPAPSTFRFTMWDGPATDDSPQSHPMTGVGRLRRQIANRELWADPIEFHWTTRANRAILGRAFTVFIGFITNAQPTNPRGFDITLQDLITAGVVQGDLDVPWRKVGDGFVHLLDHIADGLDLAQPEPMVYGRHTRTTLLEPSPAAAWPVIPIYLGIETVGGDQRHVWMVAGHACKSVTIRVDGVDTSEGSDWLVATQPAWIAEFGTPYVDKESATHGNLRRYSLVYGLVGESDPDDCALGDKLLTALVEGVETIGNGLGTLITDYYQQYKHFTVNYVANRGHFSYGGPAASDTSGAWLESPTWTLTGQTISVVDEPSFDEASAIAIERFGAPLEGAAAIGFEGRNSGPVPQIIAEWNRSGFCRSGETSQFRIGIVQLHPTLEAKAAAALYTDAYECIKGTFVTDIRWPEQRTAVEFQCDYDPETGNWMTKDLSVDSVASARYNKTPVLKRQYAFMPGVTQCMHIATLERITLTHPPRLVLIEENVGPDTATTVDPARMGYKQLGNYIRYLHFDAVAQTRSERLAQIVHRVDRGSKRTCAAIALDCEDLIGFDELSS